MDRSIQITLLMEETIFGKNVFVDNSISCNYFTKCMDCSWRYLISILLACPWNSYFWNWFLSFLFYRRKNLTSNIPSRIGLGNIIIIIKVGIDNTTIGFQSLVQTKSKKEKMRGAYRALNTSCDNFEINSQMTVLHSNYKIRKQNSITCKTTSRTRLQERSWPYLKGTRSTIVKLSFFLEHACASIGFM